MQVVVLERKFVGMRKAAMERVENCKANNLCVGCLEELEPDRRVIRGLCMSCYHATMRFIREGEFTEAERVKAGKLLPAKSGGRPVTSAITAELR